MLREYVLGLDLAQRSDWSALVVVEATRPNFRTPRTYDVVHISRWQGERYTTVPGRVRALDTPLRHAAAQKAFAESGTGRSGAGDVPKALVVDATGVGRPVVDHLAAEGLDPIAVTITGGDQVIDAGESEFRVPKRDLAGAVAILLQTRRLRFAERLPETKTLVAELRNFKAKITLSGHDQYESAGGPDWREGAHDDLVLALALAVWYAEYAERGGIDWGLVAAAHAAIAPNFGMPAAGDPRHRW